MGRGVRVAAGGVGEIGQVTPHADARHSLIVFRILTLPLGLRHTVGDNVQVRMMHNSHHGPCASATVARRGDRRNDLS